jgi:hypothetical protein
MQALTVARLTMALMIVVFYVGLYSRSTLPTS